jgi:NAD(P)-dependent dehydrogenase (short-subunit alcohol dehydrogenase family)
VLLANRNAVIYGAGGPIGGAVARAFAREGARVHLAGRTSDKLDAVAADIREAGGDAETGVVDAIDEAAVDAHADALVERYGSLDVSLSVINAREVFATPLAEMSLADFEQPVTTLVRSTFITARAAARHMIRQRSGVILSFGGFGAPLRDFFLGGFQVGLAAVEVLCRQLAAELGPHGIRVVTLQSSGVVDGFPTDFEGAEEIVEDIKSKSMLGRGATLADVGNVAVFAASDHARAITATALNITCGTEVP